MAAPGSLAPGPRAQLRRPLARILSRRCSRRRHPSILLHPRPTLQSFFTGYLSGQRGASAHTVAAYRDTWRLLLTYLSSSRHLHPSVIGFADLDAEAVTDFLTYLETSRGNSAATRNARLSAIHTFFGYAAYLHPEHADLIRRVLAIRAKNAPKVQISYLTDAEVDALLAAPPAVRWVGSRDRLIILTLVTTGLRISELTHLTWADLRLARPAHLASHGKGRKERVTPLDTATALALQAWYEKNLSPAPTSPVFTAQGGGKPMTTDAVAQRLRVHATAAVTTCPTLATKTVIPHVLRHYVDGWVMWPVGVFPLVGAPLGPVPAT